MEHRRRRPADLVSVPDVVGLTVRAGLRVAGEAGVALVAPDPDGPPLRALTWPGVFVVTEQRPAPGTRVHRWDSVVVRCRAGAEGGPAGVREPRQPLPDPGRLQASRSLTEEPG